MNTRSLIADHGTLTNEGKSMGGERPTMIDQEDPSPFDKSSIADDENSVVD